MYHDFATLYFNKIVFLTWYGMAWSIIYSSIVSKVRFKHYIQYMYFIIASIDAKRNPLPNYTRCYTKIYLIIIYCFGLYWNIFVFFSIFIFIERWQQEKLFIRLLAIDLKQFHSYKFTVVLILSFTLSFFFCCLLLW